MTKEARYSTKDLEALAGKKGQIAIDEMRKALRWAARTLEAADVAVKSECARATQAASVEREACLQDCAGWTTLQRPDVNDGKPWQAQNDPNGYCRAAIWARSKT